MNLLVLKTFVLFILYVCKCNNNKYNSKNSGDYNKEYLTKSEIKQLIINSLQNSNISPDIDANNKIIQNVMKDIPELVHESELDKYLSTDRFIKVIEDLFKKEMGEEKFNKFKNHLHKLEEKSKAHNSNKSSNNKKDKGEHIEL